MAKVTIEIEADDPLATSMELGEVSEETVNKLIQAVVWVFAEGFMRDIRTEQGRYAGFFNAVRDEHGAKVGARDEGGPTLAFTRGES